MMSDKQLKNKAIKFRGSDYVQVKDRINYLSTNHEWKYSIKTSYEYFSDNKTWVVKAILELDWQEYHWLAQEIEWSSFINKTSALENAETSAVWRACAMAGIWVIDSIASIDEINKATNRPAKKKIWATEMKAIEKAVKEWKYIDWISLSWDLDWKYTWTDTQESLMKWYFK